MAKESRCLEAKESGLPGSMVYWSRGIDLTRSHGLADRTREITTYRTLATVSRQVGKGGLCEASQ